MDKIYSYSIFLLSRQDYSEFKIRQKLKQKQFLPHEIEETIHKLKNSGYLKEENYRRLFIRKWMLKGESVEKIRNRGAQEKLTFAVEEFGMVENELGISCDDNIEKLIEKKLRSKILPDSFEEKSKLRNKILRYLISKGHSYDAAAKALKRHQL
jgi:regulatory protein